LKLTGVHLKGHMLTLDADVTKQPEASIEVQTPWKIGTVQGGSTAPPADGWTRLTFADVPEAGEPQYAHHRMTVDLQMP
jgi:hypothetical protein